MKGKWKLWGALKGTQRGMMCPEMHTGVPGMHQKAQEGTWCILKCTLRPIGSERGRTG